VHPQDDNVIKPRDAVAKKHRNSHNIQDCRFKGAVFDFDGTISLLREQWPGVMARMMIEMICGEAELTSQIQQEVGQYVEASAGFSTITQMRYLVKLVKKYGQIPSNQILTAEAYKEIYDQRLLSVVNDKLKMLEDGRLARHQLIVSGVVEFLEFLVSRDIVLYIASTTDLRFLEREANALKVAHYFRAIYGPDATLPEYTKEWLVGKVIEWHALAPDQLLVVGDGQVEISVARKYGGFALGVASTEEPTGSVNKEKREMLIKAGADAIVPDFSNVSEIFG
jgi:phosphoglycolate phosphatase-like HAD superfamily hydrolase